MVEGEDPGVRGNESVARCATMLICEKVYNWECSSMDFSMEVYKRGKRRGFLLLI